VKGRDSVRPRGEDVVPFPSERLQLCSWGGALCPISILEVTKLVFLV